MPRRPTPSGRRPVASCMKVLIYLAIGFVVGLGGGYMIMGTAHAILETRATNHFAATGKAGSHASKGHHSGAHVHTAKGGDTDAAQNTIHTLCTSNGSPYQNYQLRIAYATYQLIQDMPGGERHVAFTRILHRTEDDVLSTEVPTYRANPLQPACDNWCEYPVSDRANAVRQFLEDARHDADLIQAPWLYMVESDYVFMKPLDLPLASAAPKTVWAFPFEYIAPKAHPQEVRKLYPESAGPVSDVPNSGPAPVVMRREDWELITPDWERLTAVIEADVPMREKLSWVREMYAFSSALALHKMNVDLTEPPDNHFVVQPPVDDNLGQAHAYHYTQCTIYKTMDDQDVWGYDKRFFTSPEVVLSVPLIDLPPKWKAGKYKFIEGPPVTKEKHETILRMFKQMNTGIATLKDLS